MTAETFRSRLKAGERLLGTMITLPNASTAEVLAEVGWDWFFLDGEHGPLESSELLTIMQAVSHKVPCVVRVPSGDAVSIKKALDLGAHGIIAPQINTANQAMNVVDACKYAPEGSRGVGLARAHGYGFGFQEYVENANERVAVAGIGVGGKGASDIAGAKGAGADIVALCDVDSKRLATALKKYPGSKGFSDYRKMLDEMRGSLDAVTVSTPDHMHFHAALSAIRMGSAP